MEPFQTRLTIDWADLDLFGHVNNVAIFRFIQSARVQFCMHCGLNTFGTQGAGFTVASVRCDFLKPVKYPATITVFTSVDWTKNSSFQLEHKICDENGTIYAKGYDVLVTFDHSANEKLPVPEIIKTYVKVN